MPLSHALIRKTENQILLSQQESEDKNKEKENSIR